MKKLLITIIAVASVAIAPSVPTFGQSSLNTSVSMGYVIPLGKLRSTNTGTENAGYSDPGFNLIVDCDYPLNDQLSLSGRVYFGTTTIDQSSYMKKMNLDIGSYLTDNASTHYDIGYWVWTAPMVGAKFSYPLKGYKQAWLEGGIYTGINFSQIPDQNMLVVDSVNSRVVITENKESLDFSLPIMIDAGIRMKINSQMQVNIKAGYFQTWTKYTHWSYWGYENGSEIEGTIKETAQKIPVKTLNFSIGLVYSLW
jgi:hypothetical protein